MDDVYSERLREETLQRQINDTRERTRRERTFAVRFVGQQLFAEQLPKDDRPGINITLFGISSSGTNLGRHRD